MNNAESHNAERVLSSVAQRLLEEHLDAVERVLAESGVSRSERRSICDEVEAQAVEMVWDRSEGAPTEQVMKAVLAELDGPEAYRTTEKPERQRTVETDSNAPPKIHPYAWWALLIPVAAILAIVLNVTRGETEIMSLIGVISPLSILFGVLAIQSIRRSPDRFSGIGLAIFGMLVFPIIVFNLLVIAVGVGIGGGISTLIGRHFFSEMLSVLIMVLSIALAQWISVRFGVWLYRRYRPKEVRSPSDAASVR